MKEQDSNTIDIGPVEFNFTVSMDVKGIQVIPADSIQVEESATPRDALNKSVDCSSTHRKLSRADGLFRVSLGS